MNFTNIVTEWSALLLHIREVPGSNIGPETAYSFPQSLQANAGIVN
jgi:hypothetical protein